MNEDVELEELLKKFSCLLKFVKMNNIDHLKQKYKLVFQNINEADLDNINDAWENIKDYSKIISEHFHKIKIIFNGKIKSKMTSTTKRAELLKFIDFSKNSLNDGDDFENSLENSGWNLDEVSLELDDFELFLDAVLSGLYFFARILPKIKEYIYNSTYDTVIEADFEKYIKIGNASRVSPNYENSNIYKLEQLLVNRADYVANSDSFGPSDINTDKAFIALVCPSLSGKTQSAFTIDRIRPLYFALDYSTSTQQSVYTKFKNLNEALKDAAKEDFEVLKSKFEDPEHKNFTEEEKMLHNISSSSLETRFRNVSLFTLGFLVKLIQDSERDEEEMEKDGISWMRFHAERKSFNYSAMSINEVAELGPEFIEKIKSKYYLFLDEFVGHGWAVLVRNLSRCLRLCAVVANTNSDIANLIGKLHSGASRGGRWDVWSFVVVKLDKTDWELLKNYWYSTSHQNLTSKIGLIIENAKGYNGVGCKIEEMLSELSLSPASPQESKFVRFFRDLINNEIPKLRPGISFIIADLIMEFNINCDYDLPYFIDYLVNSLMEWVSRRKPRIKRSIQGKMGTLALYLSNAYDKTRIKPEIEHRKSYLNDHLYYLNNPANEDEWMFLTFPYDGKEKSLWIHRKGSGDISSEDKEWDVEPTHFDGNELFTILACLFIKSPQSVAYDLEQGHNESTKNNFDTSSTLNPEALKLDGNAFEVLAAVSIIDASHRKNGSLIASLSGQNGLTFVKNILGNIIRNRDYLRTTGISLKFSETKRTELSLEEILGNCKIPFLYSANLNVPQFLQRLTSEGTVNVGSCARCEDIEKIDFKFSFEYMNNSSPPPPKISKTSPYYQSRSKIEKYYVVAECKNWAKSVGSLLLIDILEKSYAHKESFLSLLFCNELAKIQSKKFSEFCMKNEINVYRVKPQNDSFLIEPLFESPNKKLPEMICIIFETKNINNVTIKE